MWNFLATFMLISLMIFSTNAGAQSIDGVPIGSTVPSTGKFTNLEATTQITLGSETATSFSDIDGKTVKSSSTDSTAGFLQDELQAGTNVTISEVDVGGNKKVSVSVPDKLTIKGDVLYHNGTSETALAVGDDGQVLTSDSSGNISWTNPTEGDQLFNSNVLLNSYRTAENIDLPVLKMIDGTVDAFTDESGVDTTASTNASFDASAATYSPTGTGTVPLIEFDGTNDYFNRGAPLTGLVDGKTGTLSFLMRPTATNGSKFIFTSTAESVFVRTVGDALDIKLFTGSTTLLQMFATQVITVGKLVHIFASWDLGNNKANIYIDGVDKTTIAVGPINNNIDYVKDNWHVGNRVLIPTSFMEGVLGQFWFSSEYVDPATDINKFYINGPVDLGGDGSLPTGTQPIIFLNNSPATWGNNLGSGGNFSAVGSVVDAGTIFQGPFNDLTLVSNSQTAKTEPNGANILLLAEDVGADIVLNQDLKASVSRDGGTTFTQVTLSDAGEFEKGNLLTGTVDLSSQPSGTDMEWKVETDNNKDLNLHGVGLEWR